MARRTVWTVLASLALVAAPLAAQDTTKADTTAARKDSVAVVQPTAQPAPQPAAAPADQPAAAPAAPDTAAGSVVRPGMTEAEVRSRWGAPLAERTANDWTYMYYRNKRERRVGFEDVVMLQHGQVMDAIVRSPDHVYAGVSSSPEGRAPVFTPPQGQPADSAKGAAVTGVQVKPGQ